MTSNLNFSSENIKPAVESGGFRKELSTQGTEKLQTIQANYKRVGLFRNHLISYLGILPIYSDSDLRSALDSYNLQLTKLNTIAHFGGQMQQPFSVAFGLEREALAHIQSLFCYRRFYFVCALLIKLATCFYNGRANLLNLIVFCVLKL